MHNWFFLSTGHHRGLKSLVRICGPNEYRNKRYPSDGVRAQCTTSCEVSDRHTQPLSLSDSRGMENDCYLKFYVEGLYTGILPSLSLFSPSFIPPFLPSLLSSFFSSLVLEIKLVIFLLQPPAVLSSQSSDLNKDLFSEL